MSDGPTSSQDPDEELIPPERWIFWPSFDFSYVSRPFHWAALGSNRLFGIQPAESRRRVPPRKPLPRAKSPDGHGWFRTSDLSRVKRALSH